MLINKAFIKKLNNLKKSVDKYIIIGYNNTCQQTMSGRLAQLGEHLPYKQGVTGSSPVVPTTFFIIVGLVVQLVRTLACHARGRGFEPHSGRQFFLYFFMVGQIAQSVEQRTENPRVGSSILSLTTIINAGVAQLIERRLAKAEVAGLSPVSRSIYFHKYKKIGNIFLVC